LVVGLFVKVTKLHTYSITTVVVLYVQCIDKLYYYSLLISYFLRLYNFVDRQPSKKKNKNKKKTKKKQTSY